MIQPQVIMDLLTRQFLDVMGKDYHYYKEYDIELSNEQYYIRDRERNPKKIYIVVKFLESEINFNQVTLPINFNVIAEKNKLDVCQRLLLDFAQQYNLKQEKMGSTLIRQIYNSPTVMSNFVDVQDGLRSLFFMSGTYFISENMNPLKLYVSASEYVDENGNREEIEFVNFASSFDVQADPQAYFNSNNRTITTNKVATFTFNINVFNTTNSHLLNKVMDIEFEDLDERPHDIETPFYFDLEYENGKTYKEKAFKLVNVTRQSVIANMPTVSLTFTR